MVKSKTQAPRVGPGLRLPEGVREVAAVGEPLVMGAAHVTFELEGIEGAKVTLCLDEGRMVGLVVSGEISTRALHRIPLRTLERYALAYVRHWARRYRDPEYLDHLALVEVKLRGSTKTRKELAERFGATFHPMATAYEQATVEPPSESSTRDHYLAQLAARYVALCGQSGRPTKMLAEEMDVPIATVRDQLADARRRGLLLAAGPGRAGGDLTPKAVALLSADEA